MSSVSNNANAHVIWVLDDDDSIRWVLERALGKAGFQVVTFASGADLHAALAATENTGAMDLPGGQAPSVVLTDVRMPGEDGLQVLARLQQGHSHIPVIVMTAHSDLDSAVSAFQGGAFEYLPKPFDLEDAIQTVWRAIEQRQKHTQPAPHEPEISSELIGEAPAMQEVFRAIGRLSHSSVSVLITGASGTGKELVAKALHQHSPRAHAPFIALNMAAIPADLVESELFGHEKGAFTGATQKRQGRFEQANGGTLFLDEIGDMPLAVQTRLLRVLAEGQFYPVGGHQPVQVDVRIIAATHQQLEQKVTSGEFREDLFHRLNVIRLQLPSLSDRRSDIPKLAYHFLQRAAKELGGEPKQLSATAMQALQDAAWPGNVRQLENTCRWLTVMAPGQQIARSDLPEDILRSLGDSTVVPDATKTAANDGGDWLDGFAAWFATQLASERDALWPEIQQQLEYQALQQTLEYCGGHRQHTAKRLGWGRNTITRKLAELEASAGSSESVKKG